MFVYKADHNAIVASATQSAIAQRDVHIQTLRGVACLLIVAFHVTGTDGTHGVQIAANHPLAIFNTLLAPVRLPLFTFISGYVYAMRPVRIGQEWPFLRGKARRLLVPLIVVSGIYFLIQLLVPETHYYLPPHEVWRIFVFPYQHLWYLQALALIFAVTVALESAGQLDDWQKWLITLGASVAIYLSVKLPLNVFAINDAIFLMPFFTLGVGIRRFAPHVRGRALQAASAAIAVIGLVIYFFMILRATPLTELDQDLLRVTIGMPACIALCSLEFENDLLARIGGYSYAIYLFHILGTAGARMTLMKLGLQNTNVLIVAVFLSGLILPILVHYLADQSKITGFLLLGRNPGRSGARRAASVPQIGHLGKLRTGSP